MQKVLILIMCLAIVVIAGSRETRIMEENFSPTNMRVLATMLHNEVCYDLDSLFGFTLNTFPDSLYKPALKTLRLYTDSIIGVGGARYLSKTKKYTLTVYDDFDTTADDNSEQSICIDSLPALSRLLDTWIICTVDALDSGDVAVVVSMDCGTAAGGAQIFTAAEVDAEDDVAAMTATEIFDVAPQNAKVPLFLNATPDTVWHNLTIGTWIMYIYYNDYASY